MDTVKVLVADGDDSAREGLCLMLEDQGHIVTTARNDAQALQALATKPPHVVLLDAQLPDSGGFDITRHIKARKPEIKVIILTVFDECLDEALAAGADAYLLKGSSSAELQAAIHRVMQQV